MKYLLTIIILIISISTNAEVITDGTLGQQINLSGLNFQITSDLGQQHGGNLFHSFQDFNLNSSETATFSGSNSINNIISRVTGGNPSNIDGLIRSTIPNADFYFLNPYGIMFGSNAKLDVQGSFHASTADYLRLGNEGRFDAKNLNQSLLTVAPITAFGFLTDSSATITMQDSKLSVPTGKTFSLISGDLTLNKTKLYIPSGQINLASIKGQGEIIPTDIPELSGNIKISNNSLLDISGEGSGNLFIRSGQFVINGSNIKANSLDKNGGEISIQANNINFTRGSSLVGQTRGAGNATKVTLQATESVKFSGTSKDGYSSRIDTRSYGTGNSGSLTVNAEQIAMKDGMLMFVGSRGKGNATNINFHSDKIIFTEGSSILSGSFGSGKAANINIYAKEILELTGTSPTATFGSRIYSGNTRGSGNSGQIYIEAQDVLITDGGLINASASGTGDAGNIHLKINGTITITGVDKKGLQSSITADTFPLPEGDIGGIGGTIFIEAEQLILKKGGVISATTNATKDNYSGLGGNIKIRVKGKAEFNGVNPNGENIYGFGSGIYAGSRGIGGNAGDGGNIDLQAGSLFLTDGAVIKNTTNNNANSGNIILNIKDKITITGDSTLAILQKPKQTQLEYLQDFSPSNYNQSTSGIYASSTSDNEQSGNSGNIDLNAGQLVMQKNGIISTSSTGGGKSGNIILQVGKLQLDNNSIIASGSQMVNTYTFANSTELNKSITIRGDIIEVTDIGVNKTGSYFNSGTELIRTQPIYTVTDMNALVNLDKLYSIEEGDVITVQNNGKPNQFIYAFDSFYGIGEWIKLNQKVDITFTDMNELTAINEKFFSSENIPYPSATVIRVNDTGNGKSGIFIYSSGIKNPISGDFFGQSIRLKNFSITNNTELNTINEQVTLQRGDVATLKSKPEFIYDGQQWMSLNNTKKVSNISEMNNLIIIATGNIAQITDEGKELIHSGEDWIPINKRYETVNLEQRAKISAQTGDLVKVLNTGQSESENFFYFNEKWHKRIQGGKAGTINLTAQKVIINNSSIATKAISAGGGSIVINTNELVFLKNGNITASVQEGAGAGGSLNIYQPHFIVLNNGEITAQAIEGDGGNINIKSDQLIASPNSLISASSELGLDGKVKIESPDINMEGFLVILSDDVVEASSLMKRPCSMRGSSFVVNKINGSSQTPYDYQPARYLPNTENKVTIVSKKADDKLAVPACKK